MRKNIHIILAIVLLICAILPMEVFAADPLNTVTVKVFQDQSYLSEYSSSPSNINTTMTNVNYPFKNKWNIDLVPSFYNTTGMPNGNCSLAYGTACTTTNCGSTCTNTDTSKNHHKNFYYNYYNAAKYGYSGWDLSLSVSSANMCTTSGTTHSTGTLGLGAVSGSTTLSKQTKTRGMIGNVRVIQHEVSHNFGCKDKANGSCPQNCIMSGGFDSNSTYNLTNIWCTNCTADFNRTAH